jgi:hypothetical protein
MAKKWNAPGRYFAPIILLAILTLSISSCQKEDLLTESNPTARLSPTSLSTQSQVVLPELFGFYTHPNNLTIGNATSENNVLDYLRNKGGNMLNCYARNSMATATGRAQFAAFCRKAVSTYGVRLITCDIRETTEIPSWDALYTDYPDLRAIVAPLTEKEPWVTGDYTGCFSLLRLTKTMCNRYGAKFYFYEGWMGKNYSNPQAAVDSMVYYCDGIFLSNYVSTGDYLSTASGYGKWDNRIKYRLDQGSATYGGITKAAKKFNKLDYTIIELQSLEPSCLFTVYATTGSNRSFYGGLYNDAKTLYNASNTDVLKYTELRGKSLFYHPYVLQAQPN